MIPYCACFGNSKFWRVCIARPSPPPRAARRRPGTEGQSPVTLPGTTPAIPGRPRAARRIPTLPRPCAPGRTSRKTPPGGRTGAPTLAAIHRPRSRASRLAQASRERLRAMRRGRRGKAPGRFPGQRRAKRTPTPQAPTDAASQAATTDAPLLRCLPRAKPDTPTAA